MVNAPRPNPKAPPRPKQAADLIAEWTPIVRAIDPNAELDFSFMKDAITICDMRRPSSLRYGTLYTREELLDNLYKLHGDMEKRVRDFMARG
jgi:hypothetical protein